MIVFFRRIPKNTSRNDIVNLLTPVLKGKVYQKSGQIEDIKFVTLIDNKTQEQEIHALVSIDSDAAAKRVIKKLNRKFFKGKHITVREYHHRTWHNDSRINMHEWNEELFDKRSTDRRGKKTKVGGGVAVNFSSNKKFNRKL